MKLKNKNCFVITRPELGWDCVTGVYFAIDEDSVIDYLGDDYNDDNEVIHDESLSIIDKDSDECFVITRPELGWDCVTGVYFAKSEKSLIKYLGDDYNEDNEVIHSVSYDVITTKSEIRDEQIKKVIE